MPQISGDKEEAQMEQMATALQENPWAFPFC